MLDSFDLTTGGVWIGEWYILGIRLWVGMVVMVGVVVGGVVDEAMYISGVEDAAVVWDRWIESVVVMLLVVMVDCCCCWG